MLIPFEAEHLLELTNRDGWSGETFRLAVEKERGGPAFTAVAGETILACGGVIMPWSGMGLVWLVLSEAAVRHRIWLTRTVRRVMEDVRRSYHLHRLEATVLADNERNRRWIEALGFTPENGKARAYTADRRDMKRYELVVD